jgi:hypothetical protein
MSLLRGFGLNRHGDRGENGHRWGHIVHRVLHGSHLTEMIVYRQKIFLFDLLATCSRWVSMLEQVVSIVQPVQNRFCCLVA